MCIKKESEKVLYNHANNSLRSHRAMKLPQINVPKAGIKRLLVKCSLKWSHHVTKRGRIVKMQIHYLKSMVNGISNLLL